MKERLVVREGDLDDVLIVHKNIIEFDVQYPSKDFFLNRYRNIEHVIIVAYYDNLPIGYVIGYEIDKENFYCWLAGVDINYRRMGALTLMMNYLIMWVKNRKYAKISIKTRNCYRFMLLYLVKEKWNFFVLSKKERYLNIELI